MRNSNTYTDSIYTKRAITGEFKSLKIAVEKSGRNNEYFIKDEKDSLYLVTHPAGIHCWVYKSGFTIKGVDSDYEIKKLK